MRDCRIIHSRLQRSLFPILMVISSFIPIVAASQVRVAVSIPPQRYFVERIGGEHVAVTVMIPPGAEPHTYEPKPRQLTELTDAAVYFTIGDTFEDAWLDRFRSVNPGMRIAATGEHIERIPMAAHDDDHGHTDEHESTDPHIWLSPPLVKQQARVIFDTLVSIDAAHADAYGEGYRAFLAEIDDLDSEIRVLFNGIEGRNRFMVFHPSWGYFAAAYGLEQVPIEAEGREPNSAELMKLITFAKEQGITVIFVQPQFSRRSAEVLAREIGGVVITADPLAEDWNANLQSVARSMREALR